MMNINSATLSKHENQQLPPHNNARLHEIDHNKGTQFTVITSHYQEKQLQMAQAQK